MCPEEELKRRLKEIKELTDYPRNEPEAANVEQNSAQVRNGFECFRTNPRP